MGKRVSKAWGGIGNSPSSCFFLLLVSFCKLISFQAPTFSLRSHRMATSWSPSNTATVYEQRWGMTEQCTADARAAGAQMVEWAGCRHSMGDEQGRMAGTHGKA